MTFRRPKILDYRLKNTPFYARILLAVYAVNARKLLLYRKIYGI